MFNVLFLAKGTFPWFSSPKGRLRVKHFAKANEVIAAKTRLKPCELFSGLPCNYMICINCCLEEYVLAMEYIRGLDFNQEPDYERIKGLLRRGARLKSVVIPKGNKPDLISQGQKAMKS